MNTTILEANLADASHAAAVADLINAYASSAMGQGKPLDPAVRERLVARLREHPTTRIFLAQAGDQFIGIATCFTGFSTFAANPLLNIHDVYVRETHQGKGIATMLLKAVEAAARASGCCKITLEVMDANPRARAVYERAGFTAGADGGDAHRFMWKRL